MRRTVDTARRLAPVTRPAAAAAALQVALADLLRTSTRVAAYISVGTEPSTRELLRPGWLLPVLLPGGDLDWIAYDGRLAPAARGLVEPVGDRLGVGAVTTCDLVLVPALAVDRRGHRLGRGGGSYDRALAGAPGLTVALLHDGELVDQVPVEPHDIAVRAAVTPTGGLVLFGWAAWEHGAHGAHRGL